MQKNVEYGSEEAEEGYWFRSVDRSYGEEHSNGGGHKSEHKENYLVDDRQEKS